jgi:hypothetical protein
MRDYKYRSEFNRTVKQAITEVVAQEVCKNFDISIKIREEKNGQMQESQRDSQ